MRASLALAVILVTLLCIGSTPSYQLNTASWMADMGDMVANHTMLEITIPGTHDMGSYTLTTSSDLSPNAGVPSWIYKVLDLPIAGWIAKKIILNWSMAQGLNTYQQLLAGSRYLDIRVANHNDQIVTMHGLYGGPLQDIIDQIAAFAKDYPKEIMILDFSHFDNMTAVTHNQLINTINSLFGPRMIINNWNTMTIGEMWANNLQFIVVYEDSDYNNLPGFWPDAIRYTPWADVSDPNVLISTLNGYIQDAANMKTIEFILQSILTPDVKTIIKGVLFKPRSLRDMADIVHNSVLPNFDALTYDPDKINIILVDWIERSNVMQLVVDRINYLNGNPTHDSARLVPKPITTVETTAEQDDAIVEYVLKYAQQNPEDVAKLVDAEYQRIKGGL